MKKTLFVLIFCTALLCSCKRIDDETVPGAETSDTVIIPMQNSETEFVSPVYGLLSEEERAVYDSICAAVKNFEEFARFDEPVSGETLRKVYKLVYAQERNFFWLSNIVYIPDNDANLLRLDYLYEKEDAELKRAELDFAASTIIGGLPENASDFEKVVYCHDKIVTGCTFSKDMPHINSAYGVLVTGYGQCEGYAAAMSLLCEKAGIPCYIVYGENSEGASHAWNKIMLDGSWYNVDCTWDDPILQHDDPDFVRHDYLLVRDSEIEGITHFTDELYRGLPPCTGSELNYFKGSGLMFGTASDGIASLEKQIKAAGLSGTREVEVRFDNETAYLEAMNTLFAGNGMKNIIEDINGRYGTKIRSAYKHNNDRLFIVHISLIYKSDPEV